MTDKPESPMTRALREMIEARRVEQGVKTPPLDFARSRIGDLVPNPLNTPMPLPTAGDLTMDRFNELMQKAFAQSSLNNFMQGVYTDYSLPDGSVPRHLRGHSRINWTVPPELRQNPATGGGYIEAHLGNEVFRMEISRYQLELLSGDTPQRRLEYHLQTFEEEARRQLDERRKQNKTDAVRRVTDIWLYYSRFADLSALVAQARRIQRERNPRSREAFGVDTFSAADCLPSDPPGSTGVLRRQFNMDRIDFVIQAQIYESGTILFSVSVPNLAIAGTIDVISHNDARVTQQESPRPTAYTFAPPTTPTTTPKEPTDSCPDRESPTTRSSSRIR